MLSFAPARHRLRFTRERTRGLQGTLVAGDHGLSVVSATRDNGTISASVVNAGVLPHPLSGEQLRRHGGARG